MVVAASNILSLPISYLKATVAASSTFQTWCGTSAGAATLARVHVGRATAASTLPLAAVGFASDFRRTSETPGFFDTEGALELLFRDDFSSALNESDAAFTFLNTLGGVMQDMEALNATAGYLSMMSWTIAEGPYRTNTDEEQTIGYIYEAIIRIDYVGV